MNLDGLSYLLGVLTPFALVVIVVVLIAAGLKLADWVDK